MHTFVEIAKKMVFKAKERRFIILSLRWWEKKLTEQQKKGGSKK
jgi:hypothetical protein